MIRAGTRSGRFSWRNFLCMFMVAIIFVSYQFLIIPSYDRKDIPKTNSVKGLKYSSKTKPFTILFWTGWYGDDPVGFNKPECQPDFRIVTNRSLYAEADVVMFQYVNLDPHGNNLDLPKTRKAHVPWILTMEEARINYHEFDARKYDGVFNFTATFRTDSEINTIFNETLKTYETPDTKWIYGSKYSETFLNNKTKTAAWVVSNCNVQPSRRNELVWALAQLGIQIDIYGKCGLYTCEKDDNCFAKLGEHYKFYLALENSLCVDYVTEKMYHGLFHNMVPIVWALGQDLNNYAPPGSYINAMEFKSVSDLAKIIKFLDENPTEYFKYFEWRQMYNLSSIHDSDYICYGWQKIKQYTERFLLENKTHTYDNFEQWYNYFRNKNTGKLCPNCISSADVDVLHLRRNHLNVFDASNKRCIYF